jgi:hypothetical protein
MAVLAVGGFLAVLIWNPAQEIWIIWNSLGGLFTLLLYLWAASQACRFFVEARRSGLLELLLTAPVTDRQIVTGQWRALLAMFGLPVALLLGVHVAASALSQLGFQRFATQVGPVTTTAVTNRIGTASSQTFSVNTTTTVSAYTATNSVLVTSANPVSTTAQQVVMAVAAAAAVALSTAANLLALCWFGMWMGMTSRSTNLATLKTILFVQVVPWFALAFVTGLLMVVVMSGFVFRPSSPQPTALLTWWPLLSVLLTAALAVAKDIGFIVWSRRKLYRCLREQATLNLGLPRTAAPRSVSTSGPLPPIIAAQQ